MGRVIGVMQRLRDAGNTLVVVEHDPQIMVEADRLIDMGPGCGRARRRASCSTARPRRCCVRQGIADRRLPLRPSPHRRCDAQGPRCRRDSDRSLDHAGRRQPAQRAGRDAATCRWASWCASPACPARARARWSPNCCIRPCSARFGKSAETGRHVTARLRRPRAAHRRGAGGPDRPSDAPRAPIRRAYVGAFDPIRSAVREAARGHRAQIHARHVQLQFRHGPLPRLRRQWLRACGDAAARRCLPALRGLRRQALPRRDPGTADRGRRGPPRQHRRRARHDRDRGHRVLRRGSPTCCSGCAAGRRRPGLPATGPARAHAVGRRGAAPEAGGLPRGYRPRPSRSC